MIKIEFDKKDINKIIRTLDGMLKALPKIRDEITYKQSVDYRNSLFANIDSQKFAGSYEPYDERYIKWKRDEMGLGTKYWELFGDLIGNIDIIKSWDADGSGHAVGIFTNKAVGGKSWNSKPGKRVGPKMSIAKYAFDMEFGNPRRYLPARPLFKPTLKEFAKVAPVYAQKVFNTKLKSMWR